MSLGLVIGPMEINEVYIHEGMAAATPPPPAGTHFLVALRQLYLGNSFIDIVKNQ